jgi:hypothetical protein
VARYSSFKYNTGVKYGTSSQATYSVEPFEVIALDYAQTLVTWSQPTSTASQSYTRFRIVRNQSNIPETQEDGIIIVDEVGPFALKTRYVVDGTSPDGSISKQVYYNESTQDADYLNPSVELVSGKEAYYAVWLLKKELIGGVETIYWDIVSAVSTVIAEDHSTLLENTDSTPGNKLAETRTMSTHDKLMALIPRVFTSSQQNSLDVVDETSDLYVFLQGFSYTMDELMTLTDMLLPDYSVSKSTKEYLDARSYDLSLTKDNKESTKYQRKLARDARYIYSSKGTLLSLNTLIEDMTGFNTTLKISPNLMLTNQDSTFRNGVGFWTGLGDCSITAYEAYDDTPAQQTNVGTVTITVAAPGVLTKNGHGLNNGQQVYVVTNGQLPTGITAGQPYYVVNKTTNTLQLAETYNGSAITTTGTQTGTHTLFSIAEDLVEKIDNIYVGKVVVGTAGARLINGTLSPTTKGIPVTAGTSYVLSLYIKNATATVTPTVRWYDYLGTELTPSVTSGISVTSSWTKGSATVTAPDNAAYAALDLKFSATGTYYMDLVQFAPVLATVTGVSASGGYVTYTAKNDFVPGQLVTISGISPSAYNLTGAKVVRVGKALPTDKYNSTFTILSSSTGSYSSGGTVSAPFSEARGVAAYLDPAKVNFISNPSFEVGSTGWTVTGYSSSSDVPAGLPSGSASASITLSSTKPATTTTIAGQLTPGTWYAFSFYAKSSSGTVGANIQLTAATSYDTATNTSASTVVVSAAPSFTTKWARYKANIFIPATYSLPTIECKIVGTSSGDSTVLLEAAQLESGYAATDYFDGTMVTSGAEWLGSAHNSVTYLFPNKDERLARLYIEILRYLTLNTPYIVKSVNGIESVAGVYIEGFA